MLFSVLKNIYNALNDKLKVRFFDMWKVFDTMYHALLLLTLEELENCF